MMIGPCRTCEKPMRGKGVKDWEEPGTVQVGAGGLCKTCRSRVAQPRVTATTCVECGHALRPKMQTAKGAPGTRPHWGHGKCESCAKRGRKRVRINPDTVPPEDLVPLGDPDPETVATLTQWEEARRNRREQQERAQRIRVAQEAVQRRFIASRRAA